MLEKKYFGIDISELNPSFDMSKLNPKPDFVLIRAGYGSDYKDQDDSKLAFYVSECVKLNIPYGLYLYSYALNEEQANSEATHMLRLINENKLHPEMGVWFDMEDGDGYKAKNGMPSDETLVNICVKFCEKLESAGYYTGIYANLNWLGSKLNSERLDKYDKWVAQWNNTCDYTKSYSIWQYTSDYKFAAYPDIRFDANYSDVIKLGSVPSKPKDTISTNKNSRVLLTGENQITQHYGNNGHGGCDLVKKTNQLDTIVAHTAGTVVWCQSGIPNDQGSSGNRSYGNAVKIKHSNGYYTLYAHMNYITVKNGDKVKQGQNIGYMGNTGNSYGAHLHFEVRDTNDNRVNPERYLNANLPDKKKPVGSTGDLTYRVYTNKNWLPAVVNCGDGPNGYAGIYGQAIQGIKINAKNCDIYYRVHLVGEAKNVWLPEVKNSGKDANGYAGIYGKNIDGIQIRVPQGYVDCRVHLKGGDWLDWVKFEKKYKSYDNDGYAGIYGRAIDGIQMK